MPSQNQCQLSHFVSEFLLIEFIRNVGVHKIMIISLIETARNQKPYLSDSDIRGKKKQKRLIKTLGKWIKIGVIL